MIYLKRFNEDFDCEKCEDMSPEEREETSISTHNGEDDIDFILTKIKEKYPVVTDKSDLLDIICWFEDEFEKDIDEGEVLNLLMKEYGL